ncbi:MAG: HIT family protein [Pseudomonadota bacterium]
MTEPYDDQNIFAKILRGEIPSHTVYEDEHTQVIMDVMPVCEGHALVLPKAPVRNILDATPAEFSAVAETARLTAKAAMIAFGADGITVQQNSESAGGQMVFHLHVHVMPRKADVALLPPASEMAPTERLESDAEKYRAAFAQLI